MARDLSLLWLTSLTESVTHVTSLLYKALLAHIVAFIVAFILALIAALDGKKKSTLSFVLDNQQLNFCFGSI